ncbi:MAG TPA: helix-turn-helix transcriptional regulator [Ideonella sp.]|uniref:helix-turn-helix domain-containing protein n=1 Tax=Ideonella sp. TaxID=1929293 RepID=UPI002E347860|nr:helix-turn-helix transcriptional regulator [Ideonella sp.]HEX5684186.1 helix-turn-helix transcriptional regulator [Ideonella sp.]
MEAATLTRPAPAGAPSAANAPVGELLRHWRQHRRWSQLDLASEAEVSTRHLSCMETGRALPSREMLLRLAERLDVPLRERNRLLTAAGYAPMYRERPLADPALQPAYAAVQRVLHAHDPYPALAVDRHWNLVAHNRAASAFMADLPAELLTPPVNVLRVSLHPDGLAPRIANFAAWREHLFERLAHQVHTSGDPALAALADELRALPLPAGCTEAPPAPRGIVDIAVPLQLHSPAGLLSFISTITVFGTPVEVTLSELAIEAFFPADETTAKALAAMAAASQG